MGQTSPLHRARRLLGQYMEKQGVKREDLARDLGDSVRDVEARLAGSRTLDLEWLDAALAVLAVDPAEFFGRLYQGADAAPGDDPAAPEGDLPANREEEILTREEVEALVVEVRALIRGSSRMIEARRQAAEQQGDSLTPSAGSSPARPSRP